MSGDGTHIHHKDTGNHLRIQKKTYHKSRKVVFRATFYVEGKRKAVDYSQFAVESFIGDKLSSGDICDNVIQYYENNSGKNPVPGKAVFQASNQKKSHQGEREDGLTLGVYRMKNVNKGKSDVAWVVIVRFLVPGGPIGSIKQQNGS